MAASRPAGPRHCAGWSWTTRASARSESTSPRSAATRDSMLNWMEQMIRQRKERPEIGWGACQLIPDSTPGDFFAHRCDWDESAVPGRPQPRRAPRRLRARARRRRARTRCSSTCSTTTSGRSATTAASPCSSGATAPAGTGCVAPASASRLRPPGHRERPMPAPGSTVGSWPRARRTPEDLEALRRHGFGVAYRMLGSVSEAEDVAQEALLRLTRQEGPIDEPAAWMTTVATRLSINVLKSARARRESYVGPWLPEPLRRGPGARPGLARRARGLAVARPAGAPGAADPGRAGGLPAARGVRLRVRGDRRASSSGPRSTRGSS